MGDAGGVRARTTPSRPSTEATATDDEAARLGAHRRAGEGDHVLDRMLRGWGFPLAWAVSRSRV